MQWLPYVEEEQQSKSQILVALYAYADKRNFDENVKCHRRCDGARTSILSIMRAANLY
jgi:hypothetical protein